MSDTQTLKKEVVSARHTQMLQGDIETLVSYVTKKADRARLRGAQRGIIDELIVLLMVHTGARAGELAGLNIGDLAMSKDGQSSVQIQGNFSRTLTIPTDLFEKVQRYIALYRETTDPGEPLLTSEQGNRISYQSIYLKIKAIGKKAGLDHLHPYVIRHYFLCRLYRTEKDLKLVQKLGGYRDPKTAAISLNLVL